MKVRKNTLWRVPVYCAAAGLVTTFIILHFGALFYVEKGADGSVSINDTRELLMYAVFLVITLLVGGLVFCRKMTRKEIFWSATICVVFSLLVYLVQVISGITAGPAALVFAYLWMLFEWRNFVPLLFYRVLGDVWIGGLVTFLVPYLFVLFGRKSEETVREEPS